MRLMNATGIEFLNQGFNPDDVIFAGQLRVYLAILSFFDSHQLWPSIREICELTGTKCNAVHMQIMALHRKGMIEWHLTDRGILASRSIRATRRAEMFVN